MRDVTSRLRWQGGPGLALAVGGLVSAALFALPCGLALAATAQPVTIQPIYSDNAAPASQAPMSTEFARYLVNSLASPLKLSATDYVPEPIDSSVAPSSDAPGLQASPPSTYDLRTTGKLTPVRNQGAYGTCWAHATMGSLESNMLPSESQDFSEDNLALGSGFLAAGSSASTLYNNGGNFTISTAYLARWGGPVYESDEPYGTGHVIAGLTARRHVQDVDYLPTRTGPSDNTAIKNAVMTYGAVGVSMYYDGSAYRSATRAYYYSGTTSANHDVCVVGWNDSYSASNFNSGAELPGDGAWIVRNSWGTSWGNGGYFYASYYDSQFANGSNAVFRSAESAANYGEVLQHDPLGRESAYGYSSNTAWFMNKFSVATAGTLEAVAFYVKQPNSPYEIWVGTGGVLTKLASGTVASAGYHTLPLPSPQTVSAGTRLSVAVKLTTPGYNYPIPIETRIVGYTDQATAAFGDGFISRDGTTWQDVMTRSGGNPTDVCLKAFMNPLASADTTAPVTLLASSPAVNPAGWSRTSVTATLTSADTGWGVSAIHYRLNAGAVATYTVPVTISSQGANTIEYWSVDRAGNAEATKSATFRIDTIAPQTTDDHVGAYTRSATVRLTPADTGSGVDSTTWKLDGVPGTGALVTTSVLGNHSLVYNSADIAGNVEMSHTETFEILSLAPTTTILGVPSGWATQGVQFSLAAIETGELHPPFATYYELNSGGLTTYWEPESVTAEGTTAVSYYSVDASGNVEATKTAYVLIDETPPSTIDDRVSTYTAAATIHLRPTDAYSGVATTVWKLDGMPGTGITVFTAAPGVHELEYASTDRAGNVEETQTTTFAVVAAPQVATSVSRPGISPSIPKRGKNVTFAAALSPSGAALAGVSKLYLMRLESGTVTRLVGGTRRKVTIKYWRSRVALTMSGSATGELSATRRLTHSGTWKAYVVFRGTPDYGASTSASRVFKVK